MKGAFNIELKNKIKDCRCSKYKRKPETQPSRFLIRVQIFYEMRTNN